MRTSGQSSISRAELLQKIVPESALEPVTVLAAESGETHASLRIEALSIEPAVIRPSANFTLSASFQVINKLNRQSTESVKFSYQISKDGQVVFSKPAINVDAEKKKTTTITLDGLKATSTPGVYELEIKVETDWAQQSRSARFEIR